MMREPGKPRMALDIFILCHENLRIATFWTRFTISKVGRLSLSVTSLLVDAKNFLSYSNMLNFILKYMKE